MLGDVAEPSADVGVQNELLELLHLHASLLHLNLEVDVLLERGIYLSGASWASRSSRKWTLSLMLKFSFFKLSICYYFDLEADSCRRSVG